MEWYALDVTAFGFTEFLSVGLSDERAGESVCLHVVAECASDEFSTCGHIAPLVVAAQLQFAVLVLVEI